MPTDVNLNNQNLSLAFKAILTENIETVLEKKSDSQGLKLSGSFSSLVSNEVIDKINRRIHELQTQYGLNLNQRQIAYILKFSSYKALESELKNNHAPDWLNKEWLVQCNELLKKDFSKLTPTEQIQLKKNYNKIIFSLITTMAVFTMLELYSITVTALNAPIDESLNYRLNLLQIAAGVLSLYSIYKFSIQEQDKVYPNIFSKKFNPSSTHRDNNFILISDDLTNESDDEEGNKFKYP